MPFLHDLKDVLGAAEGLWTRGVLCEALCCETQTLNYDKSTLLRTNTLVNCFL